MNQKIKLYLENFFHTKKKFPGANPVNLNPEFLHRDSEYFISNKLDGERRFLFKYYNKVYTLDRKGHLDKIDINIPSKMIFDVEILNGNYFILDIFTRSNLHQPFWKRLQTQLPEGTSLKRKVFAYLNDVNLLQEEYHKYVKHFEGFIITDANMPFVSGETNLIMKWKPLNLQTVDFLYKNKRLFIKTKDNYSPIKEKFVLPEITKDNTIIECYPEIKNQRIIWHFLRYRTDKSQPNFVRTYNNIKNTIKNFKSIKELIPQTHEINFVDF